MLQRESAVLPKSRLTLWKRKRETSGTVIKPKIRETGCVRISLCEACSSDDRFICAWLLLSGCGLVADPCKEKKQLSGETFKN